VSEHGEELILRAVASSACCRASASSVTSNATTAMPRPSLVEHRLVDEIEGAPYGLPPRWQNHLQRAGAEASPVAVDHVEDLVDALTVQLGQRFADGLAHHRPLIDQLQVAGVGDSNVCCGPRKMAMATGACENTSSMRRACASSTDWMRPRTATESTGSRPQLARRTASPGCRRAAAT